jgi:hypothetical protein
LVARRPERNIRESSATIITATVATHMNKFRFREVSDDNKGDELINSETERLGITRYIESNDDGSAPAESAFKIFLPVE